MKKLLLMMLGVLAFGACTNERGPVLSITDNVLERYKGLKVVTICYYKYLYINIYNYIYLYILFYTYILKA